jgi:hypothetical protein
MQEEYLKSLSPKQRQALEIAKSHLGTTFSLERSNGYVTFVSKMKRQQQEDIPPTNPSPATTITTTG